MEDFPVTKQELKIKSLLGFPSWILAIFLALILSDSWWGYIVILIVGWYLYTLLYWKLYQRYMLNKVFKEKATFYGLLVGYQLALFGVVAILALKP